VAGWAIASSHISKPEERGRVALLARRRKQGETGEARAVAAAAGFWLAGWLEGASGQQVHCV